MPFLDLFKNSRKGDPDKKADNKISPENVENQNSPDAPNQKQQNFVKDVLNINKAPSKRSP